MHEASLRRGALHMWRSTAVQLREERTQHQRARAHYSSCSMAKVLYIHMYCVLHTCRYGHVYTLCASYMQVWTCVHTVCFIHAGMDMCTHCRLHTCRYGHVYTLCASYMQVWTCVHTVGFIHAGMDMCTHCVLHTCRYGHVYTL